MTRLEAQRKGSHLFRTGKPCRRNHLADRYVSSGECVGCVRARDKIIFYSRQKINYKSQQAIKPEGPNHMPKITDPAALAALAVRRHNADVIRAVKAATTEHAEASDATYAKNIKAHGKAVVEAVKATLPVAE